MIVTSTSGPGILSVVGKIVSSLFPGVSREETRDTHIVNTVSYHSQARRRGGGVEGEATSGPKKAKKRSENEKGLSVQKGALFLSG